MKLKYKLILILTVIILAASLPLSLFILNKQENEKLELIFAQGIANSRILARSTLNIYMMNGGDIPSIKVDAKDMIAILDPLTKNGLVYADSILLSQRRKDNGRILARYADESQFKGVDLPDAVSAEDLDAILKAKPDYEVLFPGIEGYCYSFVSVAEFDGRPICAGRLVFSRAVILSPIKKLRNLIYLSTAVAIIIVGFIGLAFSTAITRPIQKLISGVDRIGSGDLDHRISVSSRDELGILATTFNHMAQMVQLEIDELVSANIELKRLDKLKDEFLANMSHELRSPLYGMIGIAESLMEGAAGELTEDAKHDLGLIDASGRRLAGLVNDILDFSKLKHKDIVLDIEPVDLFSLNQLVISIIKPMALKKTLSLVNDISPDATHVFGDENRLQQIMLNLVGNAVKFTGEGTITISSRRTDSDTIIVSVADTGIGIPEDKITRIFESFEQADGSTSRSYGGTGLGLAITRKLVELHGGTIWVEPGSGGKGSVFHFTITACNTVPAEGETVKPLADAMEGPVDTSLEKIRQVSQKGAAVFKAGEEKRILVVDDEPINLQIIMNQLSLEGYHVITADNGSDALKLLEEDTIDLILLDVMLPRISGYELCRIIREKYSTYDLPVLMLTAKNKTGDIITGLEAGANDYLTKPVNRQELLARVNSLVSLQSSVKLYNELNIIKRDIQIAHDIQKSILIQELPDLDNVKIAVRYRPMMQLGGDFYDVQLVDENKICILLADVSGHGIPAAFICAMLKVAYSFNSADSLDPAKLMTSVNKSMYNYTGGQFITACYAYIDLDSYKLYQSNAGHWPTLIWRDDESRFIIETENYMPLGWSDEEDYKSTETDIRPGDRIILYTDGIIEARSIDEKMFGESQFHSIIRKNGSSGTEEFSDHVIDTVRQWSGIRDDKSFDDDVTLVVVDI